MPSLGDLVRDWHRGAQAVARGDWDCALRLFSSVPEPPARMSFNVGCVHLLAGDPEAALRAFDQAVTKDACMAVGFFQRGVANFQLERFREALSDFQRTLAQLRDNAAIDYTQLGLRFKLQAWEVLFSVAAVQSQLGLWAEAARSLEGALAKGPEGARDDLDVALGQVQVRGRNRSPCSLGRSPGVRSSGRTGGTWRTWSPWISWARPRWWPPPSLTARTGTPGLSSHRARDTGPSGPGTRCGPRTPLDAEMGVSSGQAGRADRGTLVTNDEQRPHAEQVDQQVPPGLLVAGGPGPGSSEDPAGAGGVAAGGPESLVTFTVQCTFALALRAPRGADLSSLRALMSQALPPQAQSGQLSYRDPSDSRGWVPLTGEEALQRAWQRAAGPGELRLQCRGVGGRPVLYQVVARHGYSAQRPEDLALQPGDTVDVLCEVDQAWLEGHCDGRIGIFPKCFVVPAIRRT
ncbi:NADPH oxidase activator 1 isoform X2 [Balaenoptera ricei]|uniref:NADPH oxidase activator 1 isoform X2 n=1 Tax=Balaenoptera ricei TaxID=2746895 RepID=UPI0028BE2764|nr:NADPH oxidase activator 1 isoform X2 [Balaenoptera ricei]